MKKIALTLALLLSALTLSSCRVNWFGRTLDAPWYAIAIPVLLIIVLSYVILIRGTYVCPDCQTEFKPRWYQLSVAFHLNGKRVVKCPKCGRRGFCKRKR